MAVNLTVLRRSATAEARTALVRERCEAAATALREASIGTADVRKPQQLGGPQMSRAFIFPGQGAQAIGMGQALAEAYPAARAVFEEVDEALGAKLSTLIWEGEAETLTLTENAQPALMATSLAILSPSSRSTSRRGRVRLM